MPLTVMEAPQLENDHDMQPQVQPQLSEGGVGSKPPVVLETAVAAPEPPEREQFNPDQAELKAKVDAEFAVTALHLGDIAATGQQVIEEHNNSQN